VKCRLHCPRWTLSRSRDACSQSDLTSRINEPAVASVDWHPLPSRMSSETAPDTSLLSRPRPSTHRTRILSDLRPHHGKRSPTSTGHSTLHSAAMSLSIPNPSLRGAQWRQSQRIVPRHHHKATSTFLDHTPQMQLNLVLGCARLHQSALMYLRQLLTYSSVHNGTRRPILSQDRNRGAIFFLRGLPAHCTLKDHPGSPRAFGQYPRIVQMR
jgi:hypothetical protein